MYKNTSQTKSNSTPRRKLPLFILLSLLTTWTLWGASARANLEPERNFIDRIVRTVTFQPIDSPDSTRESERIQVTSPHISSLVGPTGPKGDVGNKGDTGKKGDSPMPPHDSPLSLSFSDTTYGLTVLGGNTVDLSVLAADQIYDADSDPINEIQGATLNGGLELDGTNNIGLSTSCGSAQILKWNSVAWVCDIDATSGGAITLDNLTDVAISGPSTGNVLRYNGTEWVVGGDNDTIYSAGSGLSLAGTSFSLDATLAIFKTVNTSLGTDPVASSLADTLSLVNGDGVTVTGSSVDNSATFSANLASGGGLTFSSGALTLLTTCSDSQYLAWNDGTSSWGCASTSGSNLFSSISGDSGNAIADTTSDSIAITGGDGISTIATDSPDGVALSVDLASGGGLAFSPGGALSLLSCSDGRILKMDSGAWTCGTDNAVPNGAYRQHLSGADNVTVSSSLTPLLTNGSGTALNLPMTINASSNVSFFATLEISSTLATGPVTVAVIRDDNDDNDCATGGGDGTQVGAQATTQISSIAQPVTITISFADTSPGTTAPKYQLCALTTIAVGVTTASDRSLKLEEVNY